MRSYDLHLHNFPETFKGHKIRRLQQYFGSPDCGHRCHLSSACLHNPLMYSTNMQQIQNASAHKYLLSTNTRTNLLLLILLQYRIFIWPRSIKVRKILVFLVKLQKWGSCADKYKYGKNQNTNKDQKKITNSNVQLQWTGGEVRLDQVPAEKGDPMSESQQLHL